MRPCGNPHVLVEHLAVPWSLARPHGEVMLELKLAGNHLERRPVERALPRRQAQQVQRLEEQDASWLGEAPLWLVARHVPGPAFASWVSKTRRCAGSCRRLGFRKKAR
jgi:hypothetical protein